MKYVKIVMRIFVLFILGALTYVGIEIAYRGYSHWTMGVVGGLCFVIIGGINNYLPWEMKLECQCGIGCVVITLLELVSGLILNVWLGLDIWDYSQMPFNILGQVCLPFCIAWYFLSIVAIMLDDGLRYLLFDEKFPKYKL